jgi:hypothetical protein
VHDELLTGCGWATPGAQLQWSVDGHGSTGSSEDRVLERLPDRIDADGPKRPETAFGGYRIPGAIELARIPQCVRCGMAVVHGVIL